MIRDRNELDGESSPYLQQHADNPVHWHAWNEAAFDLARKQNKPVFLSIGYSTCHWCHVMERECFADNEVAELLNRHVIAIKVDREERPDIDAIYMHAAQIMTGSGGWPLNLLLTPDKKPFFAATYLPKHSRHGLIGLMQLIPRVMQMWAHERSRVVESAESVTHALQHIPRSRNFTPGQAQIDASLAALKHSYDPRHGGFGDRPKFPMAHQLLFLLRHGTLCGNPESMRMAEKTLEMMRLGGIHDHLGGGFHRYATDERWLVPHFEKMLYDQAWLLMAYCEAWQATKRPSFRETAWGIADYLLRDMQHDAGGFCSAEDADSEGEEGRFYLWHSDEVRNVLGEDAEWFCQAFQIKSAGNFHDELRGKKTGANILHLEKDEQELATTLSMPLEALQSRLGQAKTRLLRIRNRRIRPLRDDKILTDWNGLAIAALSMAGRTLGKPAYTEAATKAARFILRHMRDENGSLWHRWHNGKAGIRGNLDDYAGLVWGLLELYQTDFQILWLKQAIDLSRIMWERFSDDSGALYLTEASPELIVRPMELTDHAIPSGNAIAVHNLLRLAWLTGDDSWREKADRVIAAHAELASRAPSAVIHLISAVLLTLELHGHIILFGHGDEAQSMLEAIRRRHLPGFVIHRYQPGLEQLVFYARDMQAENGKPKALLCRNFSCLPPVATAEELKRLLDDLVSHKTNSLSTGEQSDDSTS